MGDEGPFAVGVRCRVQHLPAGWGCERPVGSRRVCQCQAEWALGALWGGAPLGGISPVATRGVQGQHRAWAVVSWELDVFLVEVVAWASVTQQRAPAVPSEKSKGGRRWSLGRDPSVPSSSRRVQRTGSLGPQHHMTEHELLSTLQPLAADQCPSPGLLSATFFVFLLAIALFKMALSGG